MPIHPSVRRSRTGSTSTFHKPGSLLALTVLAALLAGCGGSGDGSFATQTATQAPPTAPAATTTDPVSTTTIGMNGGTATSPDGTLTLTIPTGALASDVDITITELDAADAPAAFDGLTVERYFELGPSGTVFSVPLDVRITGADNPMTDASTLATDLRVLATVASGERELLATPTVNVQGGSSPDVSIGGALSHFSPLVLVKVRGGSTDPFLATKITVSGLPQTAQVGVDYPLTFEARTEVLRLQSGRICGSPYTGDATALFKASLREGCSDFPAGTDAETFPLAETGEPKLYRAVEPFGCTAAGTNTLRAGAVLTFRDPEPEAVSALFFEPLTTLSYTVTERVECSTNSVPPAPEPQQAINVIEQVLALPANALTPEAIRSFRIDQAGPRFVANITTPIELPQQAVIVAVEGGSLIVDAVTGAVLYDQSGGGDPEFGAELLARDAVQGVVTATLLTFGPAAFGGYLQAFDAAANRFGPGGKVRSGSHTDAVPSCATPPLCDEMVVSRDSGVDFIRYDAVFDSFDYAAESLSLNRYGGSSPVSAVAVADGGPLLVLTSGTLWFDDRTGTAATEIGAVPGSPRKLRCAPGGGLCAISQFASDTLLPVIWDGVGAPTLGTPVAVADGPVGIDLLVDPATGDTLVVSTGFNDDRFALTELAPDGSEVSTRFRAAEAGCAAPGHAAFIPGADADGRTAVLSSCHDSHSLFTFYFP